MQRIMAVAGALFCVLMISVSQAWAIKIEVAKVQSGVAVIHGNKAARSVGITWEGAVVTQTTNGGTFQFQGVVPSHCVGTLSDGVDTIEVALANCVPGPELAGRVLKTGQTTCWDSLGTPIACAGTGQDGELQKGVARSYTDNADGTITDNTTGLMWERLCDDDVNPPCPVINDVDTGYSWDEAYQKMAGLNTTPCFANYCDWRLPNYNELQTLVHYGKLGWAIDPAFDNGVDSFTGSGPGSTIYWSSTTFQSYSTSGWLIEFGGGQNFVLGKAYRANVRAVRGP